MDKTSKHSISHFILYHSDKIALIECLEIEDFSISNPCIWEFQVDVVVNLGAAHCSLAANILKHLGHCLSCCPNIQWRNCGIKQSGSWGSKSTIVLRRCCAVIISGVVTGEMTETNTCHGFLSLIVTIRIELRAVNGICKDWELLKYTSLWM